MARAIDWPSEVLPTPGGPTKQRIGALPAGASEIQHRTEYKVALAGLTIARAAFVTKIEDDHSYNIDGDIKSAGLADLVTDILAKTSVTGVVRNDRHRPG